MTLAVEIFGAFLVVGGLVMVLSREPRGLGVGASGAILFGMALAGAFQSLT